MLLFRPQQIIVGFVVVLVFVSGISAVVLTSGLEPGAVTGVLTVVSGVFAGLLVATGGLLLRSRLAGIRDAAVADLDVATWTPNGSR